VAKLLSREEILQAQDLPIEEVEVPEWGGSVLVRGLTGAERDAFEQSIMPPDQMNGKKKGKRVKPDLRNFRAKLVSLCVVDEQGNRLFKSEDVEVLGKKLGVALQRVFEVAQRLSGLDEETEEEFEGNSEPVQSDDSTSA